MTATIYFSAQSPEWRQFKSFYSSLTLPPPSSSSLNEPADKKLWIVFCQNNKGEIEDHVYKFSAILERKKDQYTYTFYGRGIESNIYSICQLAADIRGEGIHHPYLIHPQLVGNKHLISRVKPYTDLDALQREARKAKAAIDRAIPVQAVADLILEGVLKVIFEPPHDCFCHRCV